MLGQTGVKVMDIQSFNDEMQRSSSWSPQLQDVCSLVSEAHGTNMAELF